MEEANMNLTVLNISSQIGDAEFQAAVAAICRQVKEDFQPEWGITADLRGATTSLTDGTAPIQGDQDAIIYLGDLSQDPTSGVGNVLGYHSDNYAGIPYGFVYLDICAQYGEVWTCTLSHEVLETLADPSANKTVPGPPPARTSRSVSYHFEVCDPTQGDSYAIDTIIVSNFVGRTYFGLAGVSGRSNYLDLPLTPFGVRPQGYFQYDDGEGVHLIQGAQITARQLAAKRLMGRGRRNERRKERIEQSSGRMSTQ
jgi:hypothetical protein